MMSKTEQALSFELEQKFTRVLVIGDTHGHLNQAIKVIQDGRYDMVVHLGDITGDIDDLKSIFPNLLIYGVRGNCDFNGADYPELLALTVNGVKILACHGHHFQVKRGIMLLEEYANKQSAKVALYGHTHKHKITYEGELTLLNPGSISLPKSSVFPTFGVIEIERNGTIHGSLHEIKKKYEKS